MNQRAVRLAIVCLVAVWIIPGCMPPDERILQDRDRGPTTEQSDVVHSDRSIDKPRNRNANAFYYHGLNPGEREDSEKYGLSVSPKQGTSTVKMQSAEPPTPGAKESVGRDIPNSPSSHANARQQRLREHSSLEIIFSVSILGFGLILAIIAAYCLRPSVTKSSDALFMSMGMILVITGSLFLITAGYSNQQITPVIGLLGTIAGYVLGYRSQSKANNENQPPSLFPPA